MEFVYIGDWSYIVLIWTCIFRIFIENIHTGYIIHDVDRIGGVATMM